MTASLLPNAKQQFIDANGVPLANGEVYFYIPSTSTLKDTWQDAEQQTLNTNPVILDAAGEAIIYGTGEYRQVVYDEDGNLIWDALTTDLIGAIQSSVALFCGTSTGTANAQVVSPNPAVTSIATGQQFSFFAGFTCTGAMTLTISALTYQVRVGASATVNGNVVAGMATLVEFDGTYLQLINPQPQYVLPAPGTSGNLLESNGTTWVSATPKLPAPGTAGNLLVSNGAAWTSSSIPVIGRVKETVVTTTSTFTTDPYTTYAQVTVVGGGGGGGGGTSANPGGGGGGGGYTTELFNVATLGSSKSVTIGAAGAAGVGSTSNGGTGGTTSFGSLLTATGGTGGQSSGVGPGLGNAVRFGGTGGVGSNGSLNVQGNNGGFAIGEGTLGAGDYFSGQGASGYFGGGGAQLISTSSTGNNAQGYGAGGGGATNGNGGTGSAGIVIVIEYCTQ